LPVKKRYEAGVDPWAEAWEKAVKGPVAVVDCREEIPCNPCEDACRNGAIVVGEDICAPPRFEPRDCNGCGRCVALCPGMAVFLLDRSTGNGMARVTIPYEMREEMIVGEEALVVDEEGKPLGEGKIIGVKRMGKTDKTALVTLEVPEEWSLKVRGVRNRVMSVEKPQEVGEYREEEEYHLCRCEEVSNSRVRELAGSGFHALTALRRYSRVGLGYCQGRFCQAMLREEMSLATNMEPEDVGTFKVRPPVRPVKLDRLGGSDG
jgi:Fe-S-cluster-containing hydrogenase component 2/bacterioferritin-associated ferredoxin